MTIVISGPHGTGKSTVAKLLAERLGYEHVSAGDIFRQVAKEKGIVISNFSEILRSDDFLKDELDERIRERAKEGKVVIDGRAAAWTTQGHTDLTVKLTAPFKVRVQRIAERDGTSFTEARAETEQREVEEVKDFREIYGIDLEDTSPFDMIINTKRLSADC